MKKGKITLLILVLFSLTLFISGCSSFNQSPSASFSASPKNGKAPLTVNFDASSSSDSDNVILTYEWDFGDGDTGNFSTTSHTFESTGDYTVTLTVFDGEGGSDSASQQISVSGQKVEILDWSLEESVLGKTVEGKAKNQSGRTIDYVEIKAKFYNSNDNRIGSNYTNLTDFEAGETWEFEINSVASSSEIDYAKVEVSDVSIY